MVKNTKSKKSFFRSKKTLLVAAAAVVLVGGGLAWALADNDEAANDTDSHPTQNTNATDNDSADTTDSNNVPSKHSQKHSSTDGSSDKKQVTPVISTPAPGQELTDVRAYVNGIFEENGTCTAKFTKAGYADVTGTSKGIQDFNHTTCPPIKIARSKFPVGGNWTLTVSYSSTNAEGTSAGQTVKVN